jgi:hypothetical protein
MPGFNSTSTSSVNLYCSRPNKSLDLQGRLLCLSQTHKVRWRNPALTLFAFMWCMKSNNLLKNKRGNVRINVTLRCVRVTTVAVEKQLIFNIRWSTCGVTQILWVCVWILILVIQQVNRISSAQHHAVMWGLSAPTVFSLRSITLSCGVCLPLLYFSALSYNQHDFQKKITEYKIVFWFSLQLLSETFLILKRIRRDIVTQVQKYSYKVTVILKIF